MLHVSCCMIVVVMFKDIKTILPKSAKKIGIHNQVKAELVEKFFAEELERVLTSNLLEKVKVLYFKDETITLACLSEPIVFRLQQHEGEIMRKVNRQIGNNHLRKVRYLT